MEKLASATLGGGCFWCLEAVYSRIDGVKSIAPGFAGGSNQNPTYEQVCSGETGHAEVIQISYDPDKTSYETLLDWFWRCHDPTTLNRQGPDIGTQYRSVIFFQDEDQAVLSRTSKEKFQVSGRYENDVVTEIVPTEKFYRAEEYHQKYLEARGLGNCHS
mgnify:CR=1 FL=1